VRTTKLVLSRKSHGYRKVLSWVAVNAYEILATNRNEGSFLACTGRHGLTSHLEACPPPPTDGADYGGGILQG
jgi:hypothetical protein